jgi:AmmeMemoRadiSam system protein B
MASGIRPSAVAGAFYPQDRYTLHQTLANLMRSPRNIIPEGKSVKALIVPHAGIIYSGQTAAFGFSQLSKTIPRPHFVLIGPSHEYRFNGLAGSSANFWQTPLGLVTHLPASPVNNIPHDSEHCLEVQLPFLQFIYQTRLSISCYLTGRITDFAKTADWLTTHYPDSIFIISSDLSHYLRLNDAQVRDQKTIEAILNSDPEYFSNNDNVACGSNGILLIDEMRKHFKWQPKLIHYDTSAPASGDPSAVVGYASIAFYV